MVSGDLFVGDRDAEASSKGVVDEEEAEEAVTGTWIGFEKWGDVSGVDTPWAELKEVAKLKELVFRLSFLQLPLPPLLSLPLQLCLLHHLLSLSLPLRLLLPLLFLPLPHLHLHPPLLPF